MSLSTDLISQFVKVTKDNEKSNTETTVYGIVKEYDGRTYVQLDGSDLLTPINTTADVNPGERVSVLIKDHTATVTGNLTSPAARTDDVQEIGSQITEFEIVIADKVSTKQLEVERARIDELVSENATITGRLDADEASISELNAKNVTIEETLVAHEANISELTTKKLDAEIADITYATIKELEAANANIHNLSATYGNFESVTTQKFEAVEASISDLDTKKLSAEEADLKYANIDFSNIDKAAIEYFYAKSGLIENVIVGDGTVTGNLIGVTISGDLIEGNTIKADKLVVKGNDGLYYKLNFDAGTFANAEEVPTDGLHGSVIVAKSITATQISVDDLVAFDATIGGFNITSNSIYSGVKESVENTTNGIYLGTDGQISIGDADNFIKYYKEEDGTYKLAISADSIMYAINGTQHSIADLDALTEYVKIGIYDGEPCIELGEADSDFKLIITNTRIMFMEGTAVPAYINNQSLYIKKATVEDELRFGQFVWKNRVNGNMGLIWQETI